jgi:Flp pilus assembly protein TadG
LIVLMGLLAFSVDLGYIQIARAELQTAADAGALAGARGLTNCCPSTALSEAQRVAQLNSVFQDAVSVTSSEDIALGTWDDQTSTFTALSAAQQGIANAVQVTCRRTAARGNALGLFFGPLFGVNTQDVTATAVAKSTHIQCGPFVGITSVTISGGSYIDSYYSASGTYTAGSAGQQGTVCSNGPISLSGGLTVVHGDAHPGPGHSDSMSGGSSVTGSTAALTIPLVEPAVDPGNAATVNDNNSIPLTTQGKDPLDSKGNFNLSGGDSVSMPPGTYYFTSLTLSGSSSMTITGMTIIYVAGKVNAGGGTITNTSQIPSNLQLYPMDKTCILSGAAQMYAVVYGPTADITRSGGSSDFFGAMVGNSLTLSGGGGLHGDLSLSGVSGSSRKASLVQ